MYYKLYIDSVFILQMTANLYLLSLAGKVLKCTATHVRIWLGASRQIATKNHRISSCGPVFYLLLKKSGILRLAPVGTMGMRILISAVPVSMCMLCITFRIDHGRKLIHGSLVMGGCGRSDKESHDISQAESRKQSVPPVPR